MIVFVSISNYLELFHITLLYLLVFFFKLRLHGASQATEHGQFVVFRVSVVLPVGLPASVFAPRSQLLPSSALLLTPRLLRQPLLRCHLRLQPQLPRLLPQLPVSARAGGKWHHQPSLASTGAREAGWRKGPVLLLATPGKRPAGQSRRSVGRRRGRGVRGLLHYKQRAARAGGEGVRHAAAPCGTPTGQRWFRQRVCGGPDFDSFLQGEHQHAYVPAQSSTTGAAGPSKLQGHPKNVSSVLI